MPNSVLRNQIRSGARTGDVKEIEKLLTKGLADAITAELKRIDMFDEDTYGYDPIVSVDCGSRTAGALGVIGPRNASQSELDDIMTVEGKCIEW
ncbi:hypothetical protein [Cupriavidus sp. 8B]